MRVVCAWCGKPMREDASASANDPISHGICLECSDRIFSGRGEKLAAFLETIAEPVLVVDGDVRVVGANRAAQALVGKLESSMNGFLGGEVFDCVNARLPGGCGHTESCGGCTVRRTVAETYTSGRGGTGTVVHLDRKRGGVVERAVFRITTEKKAGIVLVRVDRVESP